MDIKYILASDSLIEFIGLRTFDKLFEIKKNEIEYKLKFDFDLKDDRQGFLKNTLTNLKNDIIHEVGEYKFKDLKNNIILNTNNSKITINEKKFIQYLYCSDDLDYYLSSAHYKCHNNNTTFEKYPMFDSWNIQYHNQMQKDIKEKDIRVKNAQMHYVPIAYKKRKKDKDKYDIIITDTSIIAIPFKNLDYTDIEKFFKENIGYFKHIVNTAVYIFFVEVYNNLLSSDDLLELETGEKPNLTGTRELIILNELGIIENIDFENTKTQFREKSIFISKLLNNNKTQSIERQLRAMFGFENETDGLNPYNIKGNKEFIKELRALLEKHKIVKSKKK